MGRSLRARQARRGQSAAGGGAGCRGAGGGARGGRWRSRRPTWPARRPATAPCGGGRAGGRRRRRGGSAPPRGAGGPPGGGGGGGGRRRRRRRSLRDGGTAMCDAEWTPQQRYELLATCREDWWLQAFAASRSNVVLGSSSALCAMLASTCVEDGWLLVCRLWVLGSRFALRQRTNNRPIRVD
jgi:hypothetical protein